MLDPQRALVRTVCCRSRDGRGVLLAPCAGGGWEPVVAPPCLKPRFGDDGTQCRVSALRSVERMPTPWMNGASPSAHLILNEPTLWEGDVQSFVARALR